MDANTQDTPQHAPYRYGVGDELQFGRAADVVVIEHLRRAEDTGEPRYLVQAENGDTFPVRESRLTRAEGYNT